MSSSALQGYKPGSSLWDWAEDAPTLAAGDWTGAAFNGSGADAGNDLTPTAILGGKAIRCLPPAVNDVWWVNQGIGSGNFVVGFRIAMLMNTVAQQYNVMPTWDVQAGFVDGTAPHTDTTYVVGRRVPVSGDWSSQSVASGSTTSIFSDPSATVAMTSERTTVFDVFVRRTGSDLSLWYTSPGGLAMFANDFASVSTSAGQVGVRLYAGAKANMGFAILAFDPTLTAVPGTE